MRLFFAILISVLALLLTVSPVSSQPESAPYLYYFSEDRHAFVIQRADGTDSRLLGQGIIPINAVGADGWWSPSGKYFAWRTKKRWLEYVDPRQTNEAEEAFGILRSDGSPVPLDQPEGDWLHSNMMWSSAHDVLVLSVRVDNGSMLDFTLIDPTNEATLKRFSLRRPNEDVFITYPVWTVDGEWFVLTYMYGIRENGEYEPYDAIHAVSRTGEIREIPIACPSLCDHEGENPDISSRNEMFFIDPTTRQWTIYDLDTGSSTLVDAPSGMQYAETYWSPDGMFALLPGYKGTWLLDVAARQIQEIGGRSMLDDFSLHHPWSSDGRYAAWIGLHATVSIWDRTTGERNDIPLEAASKLIWSTDSQTIFVGGTECCGELVVIDVETKAVTTILFPQTIYAGGAVPSPDGVHWGLFTGSDGKAEVLNLETGILDSYTQHAIYHMDPRPGLYEVGWLWSETGEWFIVGQTAFWSGGGAGPAAITVYQLGQLQGRDLAFDSGNVSWLPDAAAQQLGLAP